MKTKLILTIVLLLCPSYELLAMNPDSKELVKPTNKNKPESPVALLLKKIKPEYSRNCCCSSWKKNTEALNVAVEIEREIKKNGVSFDDHRQLDNFLYNAQTHVDGVCLRAFMAVFSCTSGFLLLTGSRASAEDMSPATWYSSLAIFPLSCLTCTASVNGWLETKKSPYLRNVVNEYGKNKTCPGRMGMVYIPNKHQEILPDAQDIA